MSSFAGEAAGHFATRLVRSSALTLESHPPALNDRRPMVGQMGFGDVISSQPPMLVETDYGPIGKGASLSHSVRCENGSEYLLKGPAYTPTHPLCAANELIVARIARQLGLPLLDFGVAQDGGELFFASQYMASGTFSPQITRDLLAQCANRDRIYPIAVLDAWVVNEDRHHENLIVREPTRGGDRLLLLNDHDRALVKPGETSGALNGKIDSPVAGCYRLDFLREAIVDKTRFESALVSVESMSDEMLAAIVASVPTALLPSADSRNYTAFLPARRARLRTLFSADTTTFPNLT
jgi:hypothetical protein